MGALFYIPKKPCRKGHLTKRYVKNKSCKECYDTWRKNNKDHMYSLTSKWRLENRTRRLETQRKHKKSNRNIYTFYENKRRAIKLKATPQWADLDEIKEIYLNCPKNCEVDHIIPLQGKDICGLHVENNLQYLTVKENRIKGNR